jgi:hypothetical protein
MYDAVKKYAEPTTAIRECQINMAMQKVGVGAEKVASLIGTIEQRLAVVSQPTSEDKPSPQPPRPVLVPMADQLQIVADSLHHSATRLDSLLSRLEL